MMDFDGEDLRDIFLQEASEVIGNAEQAVDLLIRDSLNLEPLTVLRRAFHTLKGSARMVGLTEFGDAAWAMEQMLNSWLADQKATTKEFRNLSVEVIGYCRHWLVAIAANQDKSWSATPIRISAEAIRIHGRYIVVDLSGVDSGALASTALIEPTASDFDKQPATDAELVASKASGLLPEFDARSEPTPELGSVSNNHVISVPVAASEENIFAGFSLAPEIGAQIGRAHV